MLVNIPYMEHMGYIILNFDGSIPLHHISLLVNSTKSAFILVNSHEISIYVAHSSQKRNTWNEDQKARVPARSDSPPESVVASEIGTPADESQPGTRLQRQTSWHAILYSSPYTYMGMDQYLLIPFLGGWTSIYQLFWCSPGVQGFDTLPYNHGKICLFRFMVVDVHLESINSWSPLH